MVRRYRFDITGTVQGVGFRPFVYRLADRCELIGFVRNTPVGVEIEVEGAESSLDAFSRGLAEELPPASRIVELNRSEIRPVGEQAFTIIGSDRGGGREVVIPPDIATCDDCQAELLDPADRRYRYPFINCTNCGPRHTIVREIPYDRAMTTMAPFTMCETCRAEYNDPMDRRFHAQPNACPECGPSLTLLDGSGHEIPADDPITGVLDLLEEGRIVAIKGIGGFHLAVDATRGEPVRHLRARKRREEKPFAVMSGDIDSVRMYALLGSGEERLLAGTARPIVLLEKRGGCPIAEEVAPSNRCIGVMLPYTPVHFMLFHGVGGSASTAGTPPLALVMTSANLGEDPIVRGNGEALERLDGIAEAYLIHDREIHQRADDSVARVSGGRPYMIRRSRGYVPSPIILKSDVRGILGCGAHLKNTVCIAKGKNACLSQHIGDLENDLAYAYYVEVIRHLEGILDIHPQIVAHDLHPDYLSSRYAEERDATARVAVQHHHAHIASCLAENGEAGPVIGIACDGTGLGDDGTIWGGEILVADFGEYRRVGHFEAFPLPGGDSAVREPWRTACSLIRESFGRDGREIFGGLFPEVPVERADLVFQMLEKGLNAPVTSSLGRLFDGVSALLGISRRTTYEGQAAIGLEMAMKAHGSGSYAPDLREEEGRLVLGTRELVRRIVADIEAGLPADEISLKFHNFVVDSLLQSVHIISRDEELKTVALSGGCFQNVFLLEALSERLGSGGFRVLAHSLIPSNDGGISLGQVVVAETRLKKGMNT